ncbi:class I adenylate-forming enzyme family protein [Streptomyces sp. TG1A-8]|uniref:class I adenylate-forming enzyme family protein n=1 Tax=Streptomyces sp. TG1A-8 TaxID=3051385 RepID=UPI00265C1CC6|nr:class I adenylate-forming enzyme family protein [Streptomyces sp. TG1A-8]MDO0929401.1 class I adenylate-forming enzyme family protein [Streptomyces sp. TG1A-8]
MTRTATRSAGSRAGRVGIPFDTSGSTGVARRWFRLPRQMEREVELIGTHLVGPVDHVINYAPPQHLFGALFGQWLPRMARVPVHQAWTDPFAPLPVPSGARVLVVCIPMAWNLLHRSRPALERARSVVALHSSAAPPPAAHRLVHRAAPLLRAYELLGSTETGAIAHRPVAPEGSGAAPWQALPDVTLLRPAAASAGETAELVVRSPRLARPEGGTRPPARWATGDLVEFTGARSFRLVGRSGSLIKVNGVKVHLARIDERLRARLPRADCVALPRPGDPLAGEGYAVFWSGRHNGVDVADIRAALRDFPSPSQIVELAAVPRTVSGKPDRAALLAALRPSPALL